MSSPHPGVRDKADGRPAPSGALADTLTRFVADLTDEERAALLPLLLDSLPRDAATAAVQEWADSAAADDPRAFPQNWRV